MVESKQYFPKWWWTMLMYLGKKDSNHITHVHHHVARKLTCFLPKKGPFQKEASMFLQPSFFRGDLSHYWYTTIIDPCEPSYETAFCTYFITPTGVVCGFWLSLEKIGKLKGFLREPLRNHRETIPWASTTIKIMVFPQFGWLKPLGKQWWLY